MAKFAAVMALVIFDIAPRLLLIVAAVGVTLLLSRLIATTSATTTFARVGGALSRLPILLPCHPLCLREQELPARICHGAVLNCLQLTSHILDGQGG